MTEEQKILDAVDAKPQRDMLSSMMVGFAFIMAGAVFYLYEQHMIYDWVWWLVLGMGTLLMLEAFVRIAVPKFSRPVTGLMIWAVVLTGFASGQLFGFESWWPLILIAIGGALVFQSLREKQS